MNPLNAPLLRSLPGLLLLIPLLVSAGDWPQFMGPHRDNISDEKGLNFDWPDSGPKILWTIDGGEGYSAPSIAEGKLIHFDRIGTDEVVGSYDAVTGIKIWSHAYPTTYRDRYGYNGGPRSSPTIKDGHIYTFGAQSVLTCLKFSDGSMIWQRKLGAELDLDDNFFGNGLPPVLEGDLLLLNVGGTDRGFLLGIDKASGETKWKTPTLGASYSAPVVAPFKGKRTAVFLSRAGLRMVDPDTGTQFGELYPFRSRLNDSVNGGSPVVIGENIFLSAAYRTGAAMVSFDGKNLTEVWRDAEAMLTHWNTAVHHEGYIYGCSGRHSANSTIRCIDAKTGKLIWDNQKPKELGRATLLLADGHFLALGEYGNLALLEVTPEKYSIKKNFQTPLGYPSWAPPVVAHGLLYLRSDKKLVCYDLRPASDR